MYLIYLIRFHRYPEPHINIRPGHGFPRIDKDFRRKQMFRLDTDFSDVKDDDVK